MSPPCEARPSHVVQMTRACVDALPLLYPFVGTPAVLENIKINIRPFFGHMRSLPWFEVPVEIVVDIPRPSLGVRQGIAAPSVSPEPRMSPNLSSLELVAFQLGVANHLGDGYPHINLNLDFDPSAVGSVVIVDDLPACSAEAKHHHPLDAVTCVSRLQDTRLERVGMHVCMEAGEECRSHSIDQLDALDLNVISDCKSNIVSQMNRSYFTEKVC